MPFTSVILLAAGESLRMGEPKQLLPWYGMPLLLYQVEEAGRTHADEVIVVLGQNANRYRQMLPPRLDGPRLIVVENPDYELGKTTSVMAGIAASDPRAEAVVPLASDSPRTATFLDQLVAAHFAGGKPITYPWHRGIEGHPGVFSTTLRDELMAISEETKGIRGVTERDPTRVNRVEFDDPMVAVNMNRWEDYERALRLTGQEVPERQ
ncbi:MAG: nucleotidyltransferase family protein [Chloroflexi bacterium]|nr:nucleotidyltransferase family protein [Chloroflexota bacterium]